MKELWESLWKVAPRLMSVISIIVFTIFVCLKISQVHLEFEKMKSDIANINKRLEVLEKKVDVIMEYIIRDVERHRNEKPTGE